MSAFTDQIRRVDKGLGDGIDWGGAAVDTLFAPFGFVIDKINQIELKRHHEFKNQTPGLGESFYALAHAVWSYHLEIFQSGTLWARDVQKVACALTRIILTPISFGNMGRAMQNILADKLVGRIAFAVAFCVFQISQTLPYLIVSTAGVGVNLLYNTAPVALLTSIMVSMLALQVYFIFRLLREVEISNKILDRRLDLGTLAWDGMCSTAWAIVKLPFLPIQIIGWAIPNRFKSGR